MGLPYGFYWYGLLKSDENLVDFAERSRKLRTFNQYRTIGRIHPHQREHSAGSVTRTGDFGLLTVRDRFSRSHTAHGMLWERIGPDRSLLSGSRS